MSTYAQTKVRLTQISSSRTAICSLNMSTSSQTKRTAVSPLVNSNFLSGMYQHPYRQLSAVAPPSRIAILNRKARSEHGDMSIY